MRNHKAGVAAIVLMAVLICCGCEGGVNGLFARSEPEPAPEPPREVDPVMEGTVAETASLVGGSNMVVTGWGLVVGLGDAGSREVPPGVRQHLIKQLTRYPITAPGPQGRQINPERIIDDPDTAVVRVNGVLAPGVPEGRRFDLVVEALPQTQTRSLDGGVLLATELVLVASAGGPPQESEPLALASGPVFVNPFVGDEDPSEMIRQRRGRILNGGSALQARSVRLVLYEPDHAKASVIMRRINERFGGGRQIANAISPAFVDLEIPHAYRNEHEHFLALVQHLFIQRGPGIVDAKIYQLTRLMTQPEARHEQISLILEGIGRQSLPALQQLYSDENTVAAYYAARTGSRLGDPIAHEIILQEATNAGSPHQIEAIEQLGRIGGGQAAMALGQLLNSESQLIRLAAYNALADGGIQGQLSQYEADTAFDVDVAPSGGRFVIYATQTGQPKLVLFGDPIPLHQPLFHTAMAGRLVLDSTAEGLPVRMWRYVGPRRQRSAVLECEPTVLDLALMLGRTPSRDIDGQFRGLGLTYSQVVGVLNELCESGTIGATFVLQRSEATERIYQSGSAVGRPNTAPDE